MKRPWIATLLATVLLGGCATDFLRYQEAMVRDKEKKAGEALLKNELAIDQAKAQKSPAVVVTDKAYLGVKPVPLANAVKPPEFLSRRVELVQDVSNIAELIDPLSAIAKLPVVVRDDALMAAGRGAGLYSISPSGGTSSAAGSAGAAATSSMSGSSGAGTSAAVSFRFAGSLSSLFDLVAARYGISWRYKPSGMVEFYYRDTRTFNLMVLPGDLALNTDIGTSGGAGSGGSASGAGSSRTATQRTTAKMEVTFWKSLEDSVNAIKTRDGVVTVNSSAGTVTVTDTPSTLDQVAKLIEGQNALLSKQVLIDVKVVTLKIKNKEQFGIDWSLVRRKTVGNTFGLTNTTSLKEAAGPAFIFATTNGGLDGTQSVIKALADQADIGDVTSAQQFALNNQPTPIQVGTTSRFVDSITRSYDTTTARETFSVVAGSVTSGVALQLLPRILDNQNLLIHLSADLSENPENLAPVGIDKNGDNKISLWTQNVRNFMQRVSLRSGETLVLSGYENNYNEAGKQGAITPDNLLLGGSRIANSQRNIIVIMITPIIMDRVRS